MSNVIPMILTINLMPQMSYFMFSMIIVYKDYTEICGHAGKDTGKTSAFPQCMWIPKILNIELYTLDHDLHHTMNNCNYSKRFSLWDKVFGTFKRQYK